MSDLEVIKPPKATDLVYNLSNFKLIKVLKNSTNCKLICLLGYFPDISSENQAVIILEKKAFTEDTISQYFTDDAQLNVQFINDIYSNLEYLPNVDLNSLKVTVIYPATEKHIIKYSTQEKFIVQESPELHNTIVKPHILSEQFTLNWVYNILEYKKEKERIVFEDTCENNGFILLPDLKWDGVTKETLYLLSIVRRRDIHSLRDLNHTHLEFLKNIRDKSIQFIKKKYQIDRSQLRIFFHYLPSFYHLHIHFTYLIHEAPGIFCEKSHLLDSVINNIELMPDYYQKAKLSFVVHESDKLYSKIFEQSINTSEEDIEETVPEKKIKTT